MGDRDDERKRSGVEMESFCMDTSSRISRDLLKRFMGTSETYEVEDIEEDVELNLGLSLGGRFGVDKTTLLVRSSSIAAILPTDKEAVASSPPVMSYTNSSSLVRTCSLPVETEAEWKKRKELQSLRRMQARRRRSEKQRNIKQGEDEKRGIEMNCRGKLEKEKYMAGAKKSGLSMVPPLLPTLASFGSGCFDVAKAKGNFNNFMLGQGAISQLETKSAQGSAEASPPSTQSLEERRSQEIGSSGSKVGSQTSGGEMESTSNCRQHDTTRSSRVQETGVNALEDMPCVFTKGDGPNGRRIDGILYKYGRGEEIRIMCVCHGSFLSPAEFVKHAGGSDVAHPLKHIVIKPSSSPFL